jgi:fructokinase
MRIGVDLGGTKIEAAAIGRDGRILARRRAATPHGDYVATVRAAAELVAAVEAEAGGTGPVGVATPGALSPATGRIKNANSTWLNGRRLDRDLARVLGRPVRLANDADCFALSEATDGAAAGAAVVFGVILGTGVGGGIVVDGKLVSGPNAIAGEWGHNPLPWPEAGELPGPPCYCGRRGCIETFLSAPGLAADHLAATGEDLAPAEIVAAATGAGRAAATFARYEARLARALAHVINLLDPHLIVLGGGLSNAESLYPTVPSLWQAHVFSDTVATRLVPNRHGDSSGVRGAAWLWPACEGDGA